MPALAGHALARGGRGGLTAAVTALVAAGTLAVAPGTTDGFSFWVTGHTGIVIAAVYFVRGPVPGLTALEYARRVAGPVLARAASARTPDPDLRMAAALAGATLRDEFLAPGFLTAALAERVRAARMAGTRVTVDRDIQLC